jgi:hypothetical protein
LIAQRNEKQSTPSMVADELLSTLRGTNDAKVSQALQIVVMLRKQTKKVDQRAEQLAQQLIDDEERRQQQRKLQLAAQQHAKRTRRQDKPPAVATKPVQRKKPTIAKQKNPIDKKQSNFDNHSNETKITDDDNDDDKESEWITVKSKPERHDNNNNNNISNTNSNNNHNNNNNNNNNHNHNHKAPRKSTKSHLPSEQPPPNQWSSIATKPKASSARASLPIVQHNDTTTLDDALMSLSPTAVALDITPRNVLCVDLDKLSIAQLECLEDISFIIMKKIQAAKTAFYKPLLDHRNKLI